MVTSSNSLVCLPAWAVLAALDSLHTAVVAWLAIVALDAVRSTSLTGTGSDISAWPGGSGCGAGGPALSAGIHRGGECCKHVAGADGDLQENRFRTKLMFS